MACELLGQFQTTAVVYFYFNTHTNEVDKKNLKAKTWFKLKKIETQKFIAEISLNWL